MFGDDPTQFVRLDRLGDIGIHPGVQAASHVARHDERGHGHDRDMGIEHPSLAAPDETRRLEAVHLGHLAIHEHQIVTGA